MNMKKLFLLCLLIFSVLILSSCGNLFEGFSGGGSENETDSETKSDESTGVATDPVSCAHDWQNATCASPKTCTKCGVTEGNALGHTGGTANCTQKAECTRCGEAYGELNAAAHTGEICYFKRVNVHYLGYSCCGLATAEAEAHTKVEGVCSVCGFNPTISVSEAVLSEDKSTAELKVMVSDNPGIIGLELTVTFDDQVLTLLSAENGEAMKALAFTAPENISGGGKFLWDGIEMSDKDIQNGEMLILKFDVSEIPAGEYHILLKATAYDSDLNSLSFKIANGVISVNN